MEDAGYQPGQQVTPELRLRNKLGEGAMGSIWAADHLRLGHPVAVKFVSTSQAEENPQAFERFQRESSILEGFRHPNVIGSFGQGTTPGGQPYVVLEMMAGEEIVDRIERDGVFTVEELTLIVHQLGGALEALHGHGIIHRDIKAENVFISGDEHELQIKLYDFGLAKRPGEEARKMLTGMGVMVGTAEYMSPEQIVSSRDVDHYADLWAFAVLTYVSMCGGLPFHGTNLVETFAEVKDGKFERPSTIRDDITQAIDSWFVRAFHMERDKRFPTAKEMVDTWDAAVRGGPVAIPATVPPVAAKPPSAAAPVPGQAPASGQVAAFPGAFASAPPQGQVAPLGAHPAQGGMQPGMMPPPGPPGTAPGPIPQMPPPMVAQQKSGPSAAVLAVVAVVVVAVTVAATLLLL